jgi:tRNA splicing ligase
VHIALKYDKLADYQELSDCHKLINKYNEHSYVDQNELKRLERYGEEDLHSKEFDGRQIRNLVSCAVGYTRSRKASEKLSLQHIYHVLRFVEEFQKDLAGQMKSSQDIQATRI